MDYKQEIEVLRRQNGELIRSRMEVLQERDQLKVRAAELEGVLRVIKEPEDAATWLLWDHALNPHPARQPNP